MNAYETLETIGKGSFGLIRKVKRVSDGKILARKEIDYKKMSEKEKRQLVAEVNILRELDHPNIVRYYERFVEKDRTVINILMEYCSGGDLAHLITRCKREKKFIPEHVVWSFLCQLVLGLNECHSNTKHPPILHRDIKPENVFLDHQQNCKLGDFGLSKMTSDTDFAQTYVGSPLYMSPELCNSSHYNHKSDVWSLGCLIYELSCLEPPFQSKTQIGLSQKIRQGKFNALPAHYSSELHRIVKLMLTVDHNLRPSCTDLMKIGRIKMYCLEQELAVKISQLEIRERNLIDRERKLQERENELLKRERDSREPETRKSLSNFVSRSRRFLLDSKENY